MSRGFLRPSVATAASTSGRRHWRAAKVLGAARAGAGRGEGGDGRRTAGGGRRGACCGRGRDSCVKKRVWYYEEKKCQILSDADVTRVVMNQKQPRNYTYFS